MPGISRLAPLFLAGAADQVGGPGIAACAGIHGMLANILLSKYWSGSMRTAKQARLLRCTTAGMMLIGPSSGLDHSLLKNQAHTMALAPRNPGALHE